MKPLFYLVSFVAAVAVLQTPVSAVEYQGIGGQPANPITGNERSKSIFIYELAPSAQKSDAIKVLNNTDKERVITLDVVDAILSSDGVFGCAQSAEPKKGVGTWASLEQTTVTVPAGSSVDVPFTILVPNKVDTGEHNGCITIQDKSVTQTPSSGVTLGFRSAIRMVVKVPGDIVKKVDFVSVVAKASDNAYVVTPTVENNGNVSLDIDIEAGFQSLFGSTVTSSKRSTYPILSNSQAKWNVTVDAPYWGGWYRAYATAHYNDDVSIGIGEAGEKNKRIQGVSSVMFVAPAPSALLIEILLLGIIIGIGYFVTRRRNEAKIANLHWVEYRTKSNDTLNSIAKKHNVSWKLLARVNKLRAPYEIEPGMPLKIPPSSKRG
jgi:nucleoid-associated protein YgaU